MVIDMVQPNGRLFSIHFFVLFDFLSDKFTSNCLLDDGRFLGITGQHDVRVSTTTTGIVDNKISKWARLRENKYHLSLYNSKIF